MSDLGGKIKKLRVSRGYTQAEFARDIGITPAYLSQLEMGTREPSRALLKRMADRFGASLDYLLGGNDRSPAGGVPAEIVEFFRSEHLSDGDREELLSFFRWWRSEKARRKKARDETNKHNNKRR
jgi:transcriptional regulator with XRE-family HTH domain